MYYFNENLHKIEEVEIKEDLHSLYTLKNKEGLFSKDLIFKDKNKLYIKLLLEKYNHSRVYFSADKNIEQIETKKMLNSIFSYDYIIEEFEYIIDNFIVCLQVKDFREYGYNLEKYIVIIYDVLFQIFQSMTEINTKEQDQLKTTIYAYWNSLNDSIKKDIRECYKTPEVNYPKIYSLIKLNLPKYYENIGLQVDNYSAYWIEENDKYKGKEKKPKKNHSKPSEKDRYGKYFGLC